MSEYFKIDLPLLDVRARAIRVIDLIEIGVNINFFVEVKRTAGQFAQFEKLVEQEIKKTEVSDDQMKVINGVLSVSVENWNETYFLDLLNEKYGYVQTDIINILKITTFNQIIKESNEHFFDTVEPDKELLLNCHYLSKNYGGIPWDYLKMPLDKFTFCLNCLISGINDETRNIKRAQKKGKTRA